MAKAVSAASGSSSLTSLGVALGTPAYMAPEQAAADPHVDARADLYALGVVGYEMLCGRPPFVGMTPQQVLAAQVTLAPESCSAHRTTIPPTLAALVMRLLEKKPADRVQRADDLVTQLEGMATPTGGMAPTAVVPAVSSGTEAAIRITRPARVATLFGLAALVVVAIAYVLMIRLGLPGWVLPGVAVLLLAGLPIMLLTARRERQRAMARTTQTALPVAVGDRLFNWRSALTGGALAMGGFAVLTGGYMGMRALGIGPAGTLVSTGKLKDRQRVVLADFVNRTADSTLGPTLTEAFRVDLAQSPTVQLEDPANIADALKRMQRPTETTLAPSVAREVAERQGVSAVVTGEIDPVGAGYVLSAAVLSAHDGSTLTAVRSSAATAAALIAALDQLSKALRERIGESLKTIRAGEPLEAVTTPLLDALRKYTAAARLADAGQDEEAIPLLEEATRIDTGFAMAYRKLAVVLGNSRGSRDRAITAATEAYVHRDRLPDHERDLATAFYYQSVDKNLPQAIIAYRAALEMQPSDPIALTDLGDVFLAQRRYADAESLLTRVTEQLGGTSAFVDLLQAQVAQGRYSAADSTFARFQRDVPAFPHLAFFEANLSSSRGDYVAAERVLRVRLGAISPESPGRLSGLTALSQLDAVLGRIAQSEAAARELMGLAEARGSPQDYLVAAFLGLADPESRFRDNVSNARSIIAAALATHPLASMPAADRPYAELIHVYLQTGQPDQARRTWAAYQRDVPGAVRANSPDTHMAEGIVAAAEGRWSDAITAYRAFRDGSSCESCAYFEMAEAFQGAGHPDSAIVYYTRAVETPDLYGIATKALNVAASYQRLGELYEQRGEPAKAADYYGRLLDLWRDADPELQPILRDLHARLARLAGEAGGRRTGS